VIAAAAARGPLSYDTQATSIPGQPESPPKLRVIPATLCPVGIEPRRIRLQWVLPANFPLTAADRMIAGRGSSGTAWDDRVERQVRRGTGRKEGVQVPYDEGGASHIDPESCVPDREVWGEALTGETMGQVLSHVTKPVRC
jgi:hypothetical protein